MAGHLLVLNAAEGLLQLLIARPEPAGGPAGAEPALVPLCSQSWHVPSQGAELLAPALRDACARLHIQPGDISRIACVRGPGSFTGLRLVIASAAGLARATGASQAGIEYLPLLALSAGMRLSALLPPEETLCWAITHARRQLVHMQGFSCGTSARNNSASRLPLPLSGILVCSPEESADIITRSQQSAPAASVLLLGSGLTRNRAAFEQFFPPTKSSEQQDPEEQHGAFRLLPSSYDHPSPEALLRAACDLRYANEDIAPLYVRHADAVDNLERIALSLGLDPEEACRRFAQLAGPVE